MGNSVSCVSSHDTSIVVRVIPLYGSVQEFERPTKAAQLMIDNPENFVCHSNALQTGRRISALTADEELELGQIYFLLPMRKLHHSLSPSEMTSLANRANSVLQKPTSKPRSISARILPVLGDFCQSPIDRKVAREIYGVKKAPEEKDNDREVAGDNGAKRTTEAGDESNREITADAEDNGAFKLNVDNADDSGGLRSLILKKYWKPALETITESPRVAALLPPNLKQRKPSPLGHAR